MPSPQPPSQAAGVTREDVSGVPAVTVFRDDDGSRISIADDLGGLVVRLVLGGRDWLFRNEVLSLEPRRKGEVPAPPLATAYVDQGDCGLGDSCFPTVGGDTVRLPDGSSVDLVDHGLLWTQGRSRVSTEAGPSSGAAAVTTTWRVEDRVFAFTFRRTFTLQGDGRLAVALSVRNTGRAPLPRFWSSHDMLPLTERTRLGLPAGTPVRLFAAHGFAPAPGDHPWPSLRLEDGRTLDLSQPSRVRAQLGRDFAFKLFSAGDAGPITVQEDDRRLEISGPGTHAGIWVNWGGWAPASLQSRGVRYQSMCPERCIGGPTDLPSEGLKLGTTRWINPGEELAWAYAYGAK